MKRHPTRTDKLRRALAQEAARIMAEHGIRDFLVAKRKADAYEPDAKWIKTKNPRYSQAEGRGELFNPPKRQPR